MRVFISAIGVLVAVFYIARPAAAQPYDRLCAKYQSAVASGVEPIVADLRAGAWQVRSNAARCLVERGDTKDIVDALTRSTGDKDARVRRSALTSLAELELGGSELIQALGDPDPLVRFVAAKYAWIGGEAAAKPLAERAADSSEEMIVRTEAARSIERLGQKAAPAVPRLTALLQTSQGPLRTAVIKALGSVGEAAKPAVPALLAMLKRTSEQSSEYGWLREAIARIS